MEYPLMGIQLVGLHILAHAFYKEDWLPLKES